MPRTVFDQQIGAQRPKATPGRQPPFITNGCRGEVLSRHKAGARFPGADYGTPNISYRGNKIWIRARRDRREGVGAPVPGGDGDMRGANGVGKLQHARPEPAVKRDLVDKNNQLRAQSWHGSSGSMRPANL